MCAVNSIAKTHKIDAKLRYYVNLWNKTCDGRSRITEQQALCIQAFLASPDPKLRNNMTKSYMSVYPTCKIESARVAASNLFKMGKIVKTVEAVLAEEGVTKNSALREQLDLISEAKKAKQFSAAVTANKPILEMVGLTSSDKNININHNFDFKNLDGLSNKEISEKLDALLNCETFDDVIDGEVIDDFDEPELIEEKNKP